MSNQTPKRPLSAYMQFQIDQYAELKANHKQLPSDVSKLISTMWVNLDKDKKKVYEDRYEHQRQLYQESQINQGENQKTKQKNKNKINRRQQQDNRDQQQDTNNNQIDIEMVNDKINDNNKNRDNNENISSSSSLDSFDDYMKQLKEQVNNESSNVINVATIKIPINPYMRFHLEKFNYYKNKFPKLSAQSISKFIKNEWENLSQIRKQPYIDSYLNDKKKYDVLKQQCSSVNQKPKKPATPFLRFHSQMLNVYKKKYPRLTHNDITKLISRDWINFDNYKKRELEIEYVRDKAQFKQQLQDYEENKSNYVLSEKLKDDIEMYKKDLEEEIQLFRTKYPKPPNIQKPKKQKQIQQKHNLEPQQDDQMEKQQHKDMEIEQQEQQQEIQVQNEKNDNNMPEQMEEEKSSDSALKKADENPKPTQKIQRNQQKQQIQEFQANQEEENVQKSDDQEQQNKESQKLKKKLHQSNSKKSNSISKSPNNSLAKNLSSQRNSHRMSLRQQQNQISSVAEKKSLRHRKVIKSYKTLLQESYPLSQKIINVSYDEDKEEAASDKQIQQLKVIKLIPNEQSESEVKKSQKGRGRKSYETPSQSGGTYSEQFKQIGHSRNHSSRRGDSNPLQDSRKSSVQKSSIQQPIIVKISESASKIVSTNSKPEIENVIGMKTEGDAKYYLVRWKEKGPEYNTWEPVEKLKKYKHLIDNFEQLYLPENQVKSSIKKQQQQLQQKKVNHELKRLSVTKKITKDYASSFRPVTRSKTYKKVKAQPAFIKKLQKNRRILKQI